MPYSNVDMFESKKDAKREASRRNVRFVRVGRVYVVPGPVKKTNVVVYSSEGRELWRHDLTGLAEP